MANVCRGMVAGMLAGCAASWLMTTISQPGTQQKKAQPPSRQPDSADEGGNLRRSASTKHQTNQNGGVALEEPTVETAQVISRKYLGRDLTEGEKQIAGPAVHYAYGSIVGALYGGVAELFPGVAAGFGLPFGAALWLLGDEIAVPALGLGKGAAEIAPEKHADSLGSHFVYAGTTDLLRRVLRHVV